MNYCKSLAMTSFLIGSIALSSEIALADDAVSKQLNPLSVHVLDLMTGSPAQGITVTLEKEGGDKWVPLSSGVTGQDGRISALYPDNSAMIEPGDYRITFETGEYFSKQKSETIFAEIPVVIHLTKEEQHVHVPLLLSQYGYSTYKGSK